MLDLGIPEHQIGYPDPDSGVPWRAFFPHEGKGGSVIGDKIAVDSGVFNPDLLTTNYGKEIGEQWEKHRLRDRLDAVIAPECAEASGIDQRSGCPEVWVSDLVFGFWLDPCHDLLEFIGQLGTGSHWPSRDRWRPQIGCEVV